jgi:hypothetical protein
MVTLCCYRMAKMNGDRLDEEWVMQQAMAKRAMEQVRQLRRVRRALG